MAIISTPFAISHTPLEKFWPPNYIHFTNADRAAMKDRRDNWRVTIARMKKVPNFKFTAVFEELGNATTRLINRPLRLSTRANYKGRIGSRGYVIWSEASKDLQFPQQRISHHQLHRETYVDGHGHGLPWVGSQLEVRESEIRDSSARGGECKDA